MLGKALLPVNVSQIRDPATRQFLKDLVDAIDDFIRRTQMQVNQQQSDGLQNIVEDTTPQLGGDLDPNDHDITHSGSQDFTISSSTKAVYVTSTADDVWLYSDGGDVRIKSEENDISLYAGAAIGISGTTEIAISTGGNGDIKIASGGGDVGFYGKTPTAQQSHIADPSGGATQDAEARSAINSILVVLETLGLIASS